MFFELKRYQLEERLLDAKCVELFLKLKNF